MIDDVLDILRCAERPMTSREICDRLRERDGSRYRTTSKEYVPPIICKLERQRYAIERDSWRDDEGHPHMTYRLVE